MWSATCTSEINIAGKIICLKKPRQKRIYDVSVRSLALHRAHSARCNSDPSQDRVPGLDLRRRLVKEDSRDTLSRRIRRGRSHAWIEPVSRRHGHTLPRARMRAATMYTRSWIFPIYPGDTRERKDTLLKSSTDCILSVGTGLCSTLELNYYAPTRFERRNTKRVERGAESWKLISACKFPSRHRVNGQVHNSMHGFFISGVRRSFPCSFPSPRDRSLVSN